MASKAKATTKAKARMKAAPTKAKVTTKATATTKAKATTRAKTTTKVKATTKAQKAPPLPSAFRADGETHPYLRDFKAKWLSRLDFASTANLQSQLQCALMLLALGRDAEAEQVAEQLARNVDTMALGAEGWEATWRALQLAAWLKTARGDDARELLARAQQGPRVSAHRDREWLSAEAAGEIKDALERRRLAYLVEPLGGVLRWLNDPGARDKARGLLADALAATRSMMK
ncbi:MAG: hypothetical protein HYS27_07805 [Deltaproteobacteria bacterium]|nr:hypothetical protein [Deltaproteobacteria bacterium]